MTTTITKQDVYESTTNPCDYFLNGYAITAWVIMDGGISVITDEAQQYLAWPCVVETEPTPTVSAPSPHEREVIDAGGFYLYKEDGPTEEVIQHHVTKINGENRPCMPRTVIRVTERFCEGYGVGVKGVVLDSPHLFLIGKPVKVDGRHKYINAYH